MWEDMGAEYFAATHLSKQWMHDSTYASVYDLTLYIITVNDTLFCCGIVLAKGMS